MVLFAMARPMDVFGVKVSPQCSAITQSRIRFRFSIAGADRSIGLSKTTLILFVKTWALIAEEVPTRELKKLFARATAIGGDRLIIARLAKLQVLPVQALRNAHQASVAATFLFTAIFVDNSCSG